MNPEPWPRPAELRALCRLLCRPAPPIVPAPALHAAGDLVTLARRLAGCAPDAALERALIVSLQAWRRTSGGALVSFYDPEYPELLRQIARPPLALFVHGATRWLRSPSVAIVGARGASHAARAWTERVAGDLVRCGVVVASGLARGIDAAAHRGALAAGGPTVAVLGCGPDICYPPEHAELASRIARNGCVISEFPPGAPPRPWHFPLRNRILSGMTAGVVVVQAELKSGALITAKQALDENRQVMAVPGEVSDPRSRGPHVLLRQGAALVDGAPDVLEALGWRPDVGSARDASATAAERSSPLPADAAALLGALGDGCDVEALRERLGWEASRLQRVLVDLELSGFVERGPGGALWARRAHC